MGFFRNKLAGFLRSSSTVKTLMNLPEDPWGTLEVLRTKLDANVMVANPKGWGDSSSGAIQAMARRLPGYGQKHAALLYLYHIIREAIPICNNAIAARRYLEGSYVISSQDRGLERAINEFLENVPIGNIASEAQSMTGANTALGLLKDNADEYGLGILEPVVSEDGQEIERVILPNPRTLYYRRDTATEQWRLYQKTTSNPETEITNPNTILSSRSKPFCFRLLSRSAQDSPRSYINTALCITPQGAT